MKIKLSIYKTKRFSDDIDQVLNLERVKRPVEFEMEDARAHLYVKEYMDPKPPEWSTFFMGQNPGIEPDFFGMNSSTGAVLVIEANSSRYLIPFGTGHHLINDGSDLPPR